MAGYLYRPMRQTSCEKLIDIAIENRKNTGLNKVTLIGAAVSDYGDLKNAYVSINEIRNSIAHQTSKQCDCLSLRVHSIHMKTQKP